MDNAVAGGLMSEQGDNELHVAVGDVVRVDGLHECVVNQIYKNHDGSRTVLVTIDDVEQHVAVERLEKT